MEIRIQTPQQLSAHLLALRAERGLSQSQLADKLGLSQSRVARIEKNPLNISVGQLLQVLAALRTSMVLNMELGIIDRHMIRKGAPERVLLEAQQTPARAKAPGKTKSKAAAKSNSGDW